MAEFLSQLWIIHDDAAPDIEHILDAAVTKCYIGYLFWKMSNLQKNTKRETLDFVKLQARACIYLKIGLHYKYFLVSFQKFFSTDFT